MSSTDKLIVQTPGVLGGRARIEGTRISVKDIVALYQMHLDSIIVERILKDNPELNEEQVRAALQFYRGHRLEIEADFEAETELAAKFGFDL